MNVEIFKIYNMNCNQNIEDESRWEQSIKYNVEIDKYEFEIYNVYIDIKNCFFISQRLSKTITLSLWQNLDSNKTSRMCKLF